MSMDTQGSTAQPALRLGIAGLGLAGSFMIRAAAVHPHIQLCAGMDPLPRPRETFARSSLARTVYADFAELCRDPSVEAIYIASPHRFHAAQAIEAMEHGKHVLVEKPMALTIEECDAVVAAADRTGMHLIVGHTHAFDPNVREMGRDHPKRRARPPRDDPRPSTTTTFSSGRIGTTNSTERRGGGIAFNQLAHQIEIIRLLGGRGAVGARQRWCAR